MDFIFLLLVGELFLYNFVKNICKIKLKTYGDIGLYRLIDGLEQLLGH